MIVSMPKITLNVEKARQLHKEGRASQLHGNFDSKLLKAAVYGANDGIITTFAVVAGVAGAGLSPSIVLILGFANLLADGISMGIGDYLGERSESRFKKYQYAIEQWEVKNIPDEEEKELVEFFEKRKVNETDSKKLKDIIRKYPKLWSELGFFDEMGSSPEEEKGLWKSGAVTLVAFILAGALPLMPYVFEAANIFQLGEKQFVASIAATAATLFIIGSSRTFVTKGKWWMNGLEMLGIGAIAALAAFLTGSFVDKLAG
jgi:vacuolar iron transporter family protein